MPAIDDGALALLLEDMGGDREVVKELIQAFLEEAPKQLAEGRAAIAQGDLPTAQRSYHTLKSTAATFGASQLSTLCKEIELAAKGGTMPTVAQATQAEQMWEAVRKELVVRLN